MKERSSVIHHNIKVGDRVECARVSGALVVVFFSGKVTEVGIDNWVKAENPERGVRVEFNPLVTTWHISVNALPVK